MSKAIGIGLLVVGGILLAFGWDARNSVSSDVSKAITGSPTDKAMWLLSIGAFFAVVGLVALAFQRRSNPV